MTTKFKKSFSPMLICWNDIKIHLGFEDSYFVPPPIKSYKRKKDKVKTHSKTKKRQKANDGDDKDRAQKEVGH